MAGITFLSPECDFTGGFSVFPLDRHPDPHKRIMPNYCESKRIRTRHRVYKRRPNWPEYIEKISKHIIFYCILLSLIISFLMIVG